MELKYPLVIFLALAVAILGGIVIYDLLIEREVSATEKVVTIFDEDAPEAERKAAGEELVSVW